MQQLVALEIVHRDLAARNVLVFEWHHQRHLDVKVKVSDFGLSKQLNDNYYYGGGTVVPIRWMSPEALKKRKFGEKSDVWAFGVLLWEMFTLGAVPYFLETNDKAMITAVLDGERLERSVHLFIEQQ